MNTQKGIVFEHTPSYSIFLTEDGRFQKGTPIPSTVLVGEEVAFRPYTTATVQRYSPTKKAWMAPVLAAVAIIFMFFSVLLPAQSKVLAFVQVDFNPSIELGIDKKGDVQHFVGLNEDGDALKRELSFWKGKSLSRVLSSIVASSDISSQKEQIEITTIYKEETHNESLEKLITTAVAQSTNKLATESVQINEATIEERIEANEKGVSVKQNLINEKKKQPIEPKLQEKKDEKTQPKPHDKKGEKENINKPDKKQEKGKKPVKQSGNDKVKEQKQQNNVKSQTQRNNNQNKNNLKPNTKADNKKQNANDPKDKGNEKSVKNNKDSNENKAKNNKNKGENRH